MFKYVEGGEVLVSDMRGVGDAFFACFVLEWVSDHGGWQVCTMTGHVDVINSVDFSMDGKRVVSGSEDTLVKIWDAETGAEVSRFVECVEGGQVMRVSCGVFALGSFRNGSEMRCSCGLRCGRRKGCWANTHINEVIESQRFQLVANTGGQISFLAGNPGIFGPIFRFSKPVENAGIGRCTG